MPDPSPHPESTPGLDAKRMQALLAMGLGEEPEVMPAPVAPQTPEPAFVPAPADLTSASMATRPTTAHLDQGQLTSLFPEWTFLGKVSRGGFGTVYRAEHKLLKKPLAVKVLSFSLSKQAPAVARFEREIRAMGGLSHPGIVRAIDAGEREGVWYLAMELVRGQDFGSLSRALGPLPVPEACELVRQAAVALQHAHDCGLIHRDVKPGNLMLSEEDHAAPMVKVLDFGLAQLSQEKKGALDVTLTGEFVGTLDYAAPEQVQDARRVDERADVYGLGATLYRLLTKRAPHESGDREETVYRRINRLMTQDPPSLETLRPGLPPVLVDVVRRMLSRDPDQRPASPAEVARILAPLCAGFDLTRLLDKARKAAARRDAAPSTEANATVLRTPAALRRRRIAGWLVVLLALTGIAAAVSRLLLNPP